MAFFAAWMPRKEGSAYFRCARRFPGARGNAQEYLYRQGSDEGRDCSSALLVGVAARHKILEPTALPVPPQFEKFMIGEPPRACVRVALPENSGILKPSPTHRMGGSEWATRQRY